jgi:uncharacterized protein YuzE
MGIRYEKSTDTLTITFRRGGNDDYDYTADDFTVTFDEADDIYKITIAQASQFVAQAIAAGVKVEGIPGQPTQKGMVWYDVDSSMISAFGYDAEEQILDVAFHRTGVYRYSDVPYDVFEGLRDANSKGSYMRGAIIDMYPYEKKRGRSRR